MESGLKIESPIVENYKVYFNTLPYNQQILAEILNGLYSGFPICCVLNYIQLITQGFPPWQTMQKKYPDLLKNNGDICYVPCDQCCKNKTFISSEKINKGLINMNVIEKLYNFFEK